MSILGQIPVLSWRPDERDYVSISEREGERARRGHYTGGCDGTAAVLMMLRREAPAGVAA